jgi:hypothetical protein
MIHSTESECAQDGAKAQLASHPAHRAHPVPRTHGRPHLAASSWSSVSFAEPEINSLWDTGLLDRLSSPLTRYHE